MKNVTTNTAEQDLQKVKKYVFICIGIIATIGILFELYIGVFTNMIL